MDNKLILPCNVGDVSDGYHTFSELYDHRCLLWVNFLLLNKANAFITLRDDSGNKIDGWFIAGINTKYGQITYHLPSIYWKLLSDIKETNTNFDYDGHTPKDTLNRLVSLAKEENKSMKVNMDGLRRNLTIDANKLGESIKNFTSELISDFEVVKAFNDLAQAINILNCISDDKEESFNELPETVKVNFLPDKDE